MKQIKIERLVTEILYEAIDGTRFSDQEECEKYDETAKAVIDGRIYQRYGINIDSGTNGYGFDCLPFFACNSCEDICHTISIDTEEDFDNFTMWYRANGGSDPDSITKDRYMGKKIVVVLYYDGMFIQGTIEDIKRQLDDTLKCFDRGDYFRCNDCKFSEVVKNDKEDDRIKCKCDRVAETTRNTLKSLTTTACEQFEEKE